MEFKLLEQYCDLHVPEIQEMLNMTQLNETCDERHGWYPPNVEEDCRKILNKHIVKAFGRNCTFFLSLSPFMIDKNKINDYLILFAIVLYCFKLFQLLS